MERGSTACCARRRPESHEVDGSDTAYSSCELAERRGPCYPAPSVAHGTEGARRDLRSTTPVSGRQGATLTNPRPFARIEWRGAPVWARPGIGTPAARRPTPYEPSRHELSLPIASLATSPLPTQRATFPAARRSSHPRASPALLARTDHRAVLRSLSRADGGGHKPCREISLVTEGPPTSASTITTVRSSLRIDAGVDAVA